MLKQLKYIVNSLEKYFKITCSNFVNVLKGKLLESNGPKVKIWTLFIIA